MKFPLPLPRTRGQRGASINELLDRIPLLVRNLEHSQAQHAALVEAILAGDPAEAREAAREHLAGAAAGAAEGGSLLTGGCADSRRTVSGGS